VPLEHTEISSLLRIAEAGYCFAPAPYFKACERVIIRGGRARRRTWTRREVSEGLRVVVSTELLQRAGRGRRQAGAAICGQRPAGRLRGAR